MERFEKIDPNKKWHWNHAWDKRKTLRIDSVEQCYSQNPEIGTSGKGIAAITQSSDMIDYTSWIAAGGLGVVPKTNYLKEMPNYPCTIDLCPWYTARSHRNGWAKLDPDRLEIAKTNEFRSRLPENQVPIDGFAETLTRHLLHEVRL